MRFQQPLPHQAAPTAVEVRQDGMAASAVVESFSPSRVAWLYLRRGCANNCTAQNNCTSRIEKKQEKQGAAAVEMIETIDLS